MNVYQAGYSNRGWSSSWTTGWRHVCQPLCLKLNYPPKPWPLQSTVGIHHSNSGLLADPFSRKIRSPRATINVDGSDGFLILLIWIYIVFCGQVLRGRFSVYYLLSTCQQVCWINQPAANGHLWYGFCKLQSSNSGDVEFSVSFWDLKFQVVKLIQISWIWVTLYIFL